MESGVPQGSMLVALGQLLFVLFINDLTERDNNRVNYGHDLKILAATYVQKGLSSICEWSNDWLM